MTGKQTYWLVDQTGTKALVEGAEERDRWLPLGWSVSTEPVGNEMVCVQHDESRGHAKLPASVLQQAWGALGWHAAAPPDDTDDQVVAGPAAAAEPAAATKRHRRAAGEQQTSDAVTGDEAKEQDRV